MKLWLRAHSSLWLRFDPHPRAHTACAACGQVTSVTAPRAAHDTMDIIERHEIGEAFIVGIRHVKFCEGSEVPA